VLSSLSDHVSRCIPVPFWPDLHCFLLVGAPLTCARVPVWLTWSNSPPRPLVTASLLSPHSHLINADYKTRISELEPVNNNAGQRLNLRDVWKVKKMRGIWSPYVRDTHLLSDMLAGGVHSTIRSTVKHVETGFYLGLTNTYYIIIKLSVFGAAWKTC